MLGWLSCTPSQSAIPSRVAFAALHKLSVSSIRGAMRVIVTFTSPGVGPALQAVTWPLIIHTSDLRSVIDRWVEVTAQIRALSGAWESDMIALPIVLAEQGLTCQLEMLAAWMPWPDDVKAKLESFLAPVDAVEHVPVQAQT